jgi:hypothetical protein
MNREDCGWCCLLFWCYPCWIFGRIHQEEPSKDKRSMQDIHVIDEGGEYQQDQHKFVLQAKGHSKEKRSMQDVIVIDEERDF